MLELGSSWRRAFGIALACAVLAAGGAFAQAPKAAADAEFAPAKAAFEALSLDARKAIQRDLIWAAGLEASATGEFGALTYAAIRRFETSAKLKLDGILADAERAALASAAEKARANSGFRLETDAASKMRIGIPGKLLVKRSENASGGGRWQDKDEKVTLDLQVLKPEDQLAAIFEKGTAANVPGRKITYKLLRPDFLVISGETASGKFYRRVEKGADGALRGFSLGYDKALAPEFDKLTIAIAASFEPFPGKAPASAAPVPAQSPGAAVANPPLASPAKVSRNRITAIFVGQDSLLTAESAFKACKGPVLASGSRSPVSLVKADAASGLVLLRATGSGNAPLHSGDSPAQALLLQRDAEGELLASSASLGEGFAHAPLQQGGAGAPLFDRSGALVGIITAEPVQKYAVAGTVPTTRYRYVDTKAIAALIGITPGTASGAERSAGQIVAEREASVVSIVCGP